MMADAQVVNNVTHVDLMVSAQCLTPGQILALAHTGHVVVSLGKVFIREARPNRPFIRLG